MGAFFSSFFIGYDQLKADIKLMLGKSIGPYWMIMWKFVSPLTLVVKYKVLYTCADMVT